MEIFTQYGIFLAAFITLFLIPVEGFVVRWLRNHAGHNLNCFLNPLLPALIPHQPLISRYEAALFCVLFLGNGLYAGINNESIGEAAPRLGRLALINLIPLCCGAHMNHIVSICGIPYNRHFRLHAYIAAIFTSEVALHSGFALQQNALSIAALIVSSGSCFWVLLIGIRRCVLSELLLDLPFFSTGYSNSSRICTRFSLWQVLSHYGFICR
jgi:hypothetical protein